MRFLDEIIFEEDGGGSRYDPELDEWAEGAPITITTSANVTDLGADRSVAILGDMRRGVKVIRAMPLFIVPECDRIIFNGKIYKDVAQRSLLSTNSIVVQGVIAKWRFHWITKVWMSCLNTWKRLSRLEVCKW